MFLHWHGNLERGVIICFIICFQNTYFCWDGSMETGAWGQECGDRSNFWMIYYKKTFFHLLIQIVFSHRHGSMNEGSNYLICSLFLEYLFLLGQDHGDGSV